MRTEAWTGRTACALQSALRMSNEAFAAHLGVAVRTVAGWHQKPTLQPKSEMQQALDTALAQASDEVRTRFARLAETPGTRTATSRDPDAERRLVADPTIGTILEWLDTHTGWPPGTSRRKVAAQLANLDLLGLHDRGALRGRVDQHQIANALRDYYTDAVDGYGLYGAIYGNKHVMTSILTRTQWLDLECALVPANDRLKVVSGGSDPGAAFDELTAEHAVRRVAEMLALGFRMVDTPLYRLLRVDIGPGSVAGDLGMVPFLRYALTMDLLEGELVDAVAAGRPNDLPLRDRLLADTPSVLDVSGRLCSGGALALCAIARPATNHSPRDYVLLIQERSGRVLNAAKRLAVIPKGFHEPMVDYQADARIGATLRREMEEELFGRDDVDSTETELLSTDPMHPSRLSEPMRWLTEDPARLRMECTAFGLNLVSGNCEFAGLIVIDDEEFWSRFGGQITANWESGALRQYSSLDAPLITNMIGDVAWSNEGLFALLQGLRRLAELGGSRVNLPTIESEIQ